jgi:hypothetical protein
LFYFIFSFFEFEQIFQNWSINKNWTDFEFWIFLNLNNFKIEQI